MLSKKVLGHLPLAGNITLLLLFPLQKISKVQEVLILYILYRPANNKQALYAYVARIFLPSPIVPHYTADNFSVPIEVVRRYVLGILSDNVSYQNSNNQ